MPTWLKRLRGAIGMGLLWGAAWAIIGGGIMEGIVDPNGEIVDMWPQVLGLVGFMGGVVFSLIVALVGGHRTLDEFSYRDFAVLGAIAGIMQGGLAMITVGAPLLFLGVTVVASALAAVGSLATVRVAERHLLKGRGDSKLIRAVVVLAMASFSSPVSAQSRQSTQQMIDSIANDAITKRNVVGMVIGVMQGNDTILLKPYGKADVEWNVPMQADAMFEIGSQAKQFTAAMILQLRDEGKLSLDDELTRWLPDFDTKGNSVVLRQMLNHTSGIHDYTETPEFPALVGNRAWPRDSAYALIKRQAFDFAPGTMQLYSNSAFFLLGLVIEKASGMSYEDYLEKQLLAPLGMTRSMYCNSYENIPHRAHGHGIREGTLMRAPTTMHTWAYSAGAVCASAADVLTWNRALHGGKVLSAASYTEMTSPSALGNGIKLRYGYGLGVEHDPRGRRVFNHGGVNAGFWSETLHYPDAQTTVTVLMNTTGSIDPEEIAREIAERVVTAPRPTPSVFSGDVGPYVGTYKGRTARGELTLVFTPNPQGGLMVSGNGSPARPLVWLSERTFFFGEIYLWFGSPGADGKVATLGFNPAKGMMAVMSRQP